MTDEERKEALREKRRKRRALEAAHPRWPASPLQKAWDRALREREERDDDHEQSSHHRE